MFVATGRPGWHILTAGIAAAYGYLGIVSILLPEQQESWGTPGGVAALLAAAAFLITGKLAARDQPPAATLIGR